MATGRYILHAQSLWLREIAQIIQPHFPQFPIKTWRIPGPLLYAATLFDKRLTYSYLRRNLGRMAEISHEKAKSEAGISWRPIEQSILDTCRSFVEGGWVEPR